MKIPTKTLRYEIFKSIIKLPEKLNLIKQKRKKRFKNKNLR